MFTEWLVVTAIAGVLFATVFNVRTAGSYVGLVLGGVVYLMLGSALAKFGYQRATFASLRAQRAAQPAARPSTPAARARPAPTGRTSTGPSQRPNRTNKSRRR